jgi:hypothetical protein
MEPADDWWEHGQPERGLPERFLAAMEPAGDRREHGSRFPGGLS